MIFSKGNGRNTWENLLHSNFVQQEPPLSFSVLNTGLRGDNEATIRLYDMASLYGIARGYGLHSLGSIPGKGKNFLFSTQSRLLFNGYRRLFPGG
jgi:hypothetical protein